MVLFIPENGKDLSSPKKFVKEVARKVEVDIRIVQGTQDEWEKYNLQPDGGCHPSPFGAGMIARGLGFQHKKIERLIEINSLNHSLANA